MKTFNPITYLRAVKKAAKSILKNPNNLHSLAVEVNEKMPRFTVQETMVEINHHAFIMQASKAHNKKINAEIKTMQDAK